MTQVRLVCEQLLREYSKTQEMIAVLTSGWTRQDEVCNPWSRYEFGMLAERVDFFSCRPQESQVRRFEGSWEAREQQLLQQDPPAQRLVRLSRAGSRRCSSRRLSLCQAQASVAGQEACIQVPGLHARKVRRPPLPSPSSRSPSPAPIA
eukprot:752661-Hanusia_phi.AAC.3